MRFFNIRQPRNQRVTSTGTSRLAVREHGLWSVTSSAAYRKLAIAASQLQYKVQRDQENAAMLGNVMSVAIAAKIAYGCAIVDIDNPVWRVLDNDRLEVVFDESDRIIGFKYVSLSGAPINVTQFLYSLNTAPGRVMSGALKDAAEDIKAENVTQAVAATLAENLSYIGLVAYVRGETDPNKLQLIANKISGAFTGDDRGGVLAISDNVKIESLLNVTQLNPIGAENLRASRQAIAAAFGVPYDLLYTDSSNRASIDSAKELLFRDTLVPTAKSIAADFGNTSRFGRIKLDEESLKLGQPDAADLANTNADKSINLAGAGEQ